MNRQAAVQKPRKTARQGRSRATVQAILEAAAHILVAGGIEAVTTNRVAERAGVSIGSLYQYFPGKEAILAELVRQFRAEMQADLKEAQRQVEGQGIDRLLAVMIGAALRHHQRNPELARVLEHLERDLPLDGETRQMKAEIAGDMSRLLEGAGVASPARAARELMAICRALADDALDQPDADPRRGALAGRIEAAARGYLGLPVLQNPDC